MNNKRLGTAFEREFCEILAKQGWWVHFITPAPTGAQPFDVIAVKAGCAKAFDCKTSVKNTFPITRLEQNQVMAFEKWMACGNEEPMIAVKYKDRVYLLPYTQLKRKGVIDLEKENPI